MDEDRILFNSYVCTQGEWQLCPLSMLLKRCLLGGSLPNIEVTTKKHGTSQEEHYTHDGLFECNGKSCHIFVRLANVTITKHG